MVRHRGAVPPGPGPRPARAPLPLLPRRPTRPVPSRRRRYARAGQRSAAGPSRRSGAGRRARRRWGTARAPLCGRAAPGQRARRCLIPAGPLGAAGPSEPASAFPVRTRWRRAPGSWGGSAEARSQREDGEAPGCGRKCSRGTRDLLPSERPLCLLGVGGVIALL